MRTDVLAGALRPTRDDIFADDQLVPRRSCRPTRGKSPAWPSARTSRSRSTRVSGRTSSAQRSISFRAEEHLVSGPLSLLVRADRKAVMEYSAEKLERTRIRLASVASRVGQVSVGRRQAVAVGRAVV
jgi:ABC-type uncharacterized transport system ATPase subunit